MRIVIQRVSRASVCVDGSAVSQIGRGLMILVGVENGDTEEDHFHVVRKRRVRRRNRC